MSRFLKLPDSVGVSPKYVVKDGEEVENPRAGELEPLSSIGVPIAIPVMSGKDVVEQSSTYHIKPAEKLGKGEWARIVPGTRSVEVDHVGLANVLITQAGYVEDPASGKSTTPEVK